MPPNPNTLLIFQDTAYNCKKQANVYGGDEKRGNLEERNELCDDGVDCSTREIEEQETEQGRLRIAARAKQTYELYSFTKNAMLIVTTRVDAVLWTRLVNDLKRTFEEYRFEVHVCIVEDPEELYTNCEQFFRRDFTDYGAVALAIVTTMAVNPSQTCSDGLFFEESVVVDNFRWDRNATLAGKPKIYITEANRRTYGRSYHDLPRLEWWEHGEVIGFHMPFALPDDYKGSNFLGSYDSRPRPLKILCNKLAAMGETRIFAEILEETITDAVESFPLLRYIPIGLESCLSKNLYFERNE